ncbi:MAG: PEGA domain-containing protein [Blastocatellales bacterium]
MRCPKCQAEISEWHFYCQNCHTQIQSYKPEVEKPERGRIERAGVRVLNALAWVSIIAVLILTGRTVQWSELFAAIRGDTGVSAGSRPDSKDARAPRTRLDGGRQDDRSPTDTKDVEVSERGKSDAIESVRAMPQKIEELPSVDDPPESSRPRQSAASSKVEDAPLVAASDSASKSAIQQADVNAQLGIEQIDAKNSGETGFVAINSYTPARIYVNGQFSGITPRVVKLIAGDYQIRLIADGCEDWTRRVRLKTKQQVGIMASMKKKSAKE